MAAALPLAVILALILLGVVQGREDRYDFAALRWEAWQLVGAFFLIVLFAAHVTRLVPLTLALLLAVWLFVRKRRAHQHVDDFF